MPNYTTQVSRAWQIAVGSAALLVGIPSLVICAFSIWKLPVSTGDGRVTFLVVGTIFGVLGVPVTLFGKRLLFARDERRRHGLMSPTALRVAGSVIVILPVLYLIGNQTWDAMFALFHVGAGIACFVLARHRARALRDPAEPQDAPPRERTHESSRQILP